MPPLYLQLPISTLPITSSTTNSHPSSQHPDDLFLHSSSAVRLLNTCVARKQPRLTTCIHAGVLKSGLNSNLYVGNALLDAYAKSGRLEDAAKVFEKMPDRDVVSWTALVAAYCQNGTADLALSVFKYMLCGEGPTLPPQPNEFTLAAVVQACSIKRDEGVGRMVHGYLVTSGFAADPFINNSLIDLYTKCGSLLSAERLIDTSSYADVVSWTSFISGCVNDGLVEKALVVFLKMLEDGQLPNAVTMLSVIRACSAMNEPGLFGWVHAWVVKLELHDNVLIGNSLLEMYSRNGFVGEGFKVFCHLYLLDGDELPDSEIMATLLHACSLSSSSIIGEEIHGYLIKHGYIPCTFVENSLMDMYGKSGVVDSAKRVFVAMETWDVVSWNTMISCFVKNAYYNEALKSLTQLHSNGSSYDLMPDFVTILSSIQACSEVALLKKGEILHGYAIRTGFDCDVFVGNALIDMYAKSGRIEFSLKTFEDMDVKDIGTWNSMIAAYGIHGDGDSALWVFNELKRCGKLCPNAITFLNIISACSHSGLVIQGLECFSSMIKDYGIEPCMEHYACVVDLLGRSGKLKEAVKFIDDMQLEPDTSVWGSLLGACAVSGNTEIAEMAAGKLSVLDPISDVWRVALSNAYSYAGRWELAAQVRAEMRAECWRKEAGWSSVELRGGESFRFMVADTKHLESMKIYEVLNVIQQHIIDESLESWFE